MIPQNAVWTFVFKHMFCPLTLFQREYIQVMSQKEKLVEYLIESI